MKRFIFTIIATICLGVAANAQTNTPAELSLDNAIKVNFGKGIALTAKAADSYIQAVKAVSDKTFNVAGDVTFSSQYISNVKLPVTEIIDVLVKSNTPCYISNTYTISVF